MAVHAHQTTPSGTRGARSRSLRVKNRDALPLRHSRGRGRKPDPTIRLVMTPYCGLLTKGNRGELAGGEKVSTEGMCDVLLAQNRLNE